jgi:hypothetical protein
MVQVKLNKINMLYKSIICVFILSTLNSCNTSLFKNNLSQILGIKKVEIENSYIFDEWAGPHGDGFILEIYKLSEITIQNFISTSNKILPEKTEKNKNWQKQNWSILPIDSSYNEVFIMGLNYMPNDKKIKAQLEIINKVAFKKGVFCSFYYSPNKENPRQLQLFLLDVQSKKLYMIEQKL